MHDDQPEITDPSPPTLNHVLGQKQAVQQLRIALDAYFNDRAAVSEWRVSIVSCAPVRTAGDGQEPAQPDPRP